MRLMPASEPGPSPSCSATQLCTRRRPAPRCRVPWRRRRPTKSSTTTCRSRRQTSHFPPAIECGSTSSALAAGVIRSLRFVASYFGITDADVEATATAEASPANAMTCVKPFTIPDKWIENQARPWDPSNTFDAYDKNGNTLPNPDIYVPADQPGYTGYNAYTDKGTHLALKARTGNNIEPSFYFALAILDSSSGAADYRWNIGNCNTTFMECRRSVHGAAGEHGGPNASGHAGSVRPRSHRLLGYLE